MTREKIADLRTNTLIGYTEQNGLAWHADHAAGAVNDNHFEGPVPIDAILTRLFHWEAKEGKITVTVIDEDGVQSIEDPIHKAIVRPDSGTILGIFTDGYQIHSYKEWLLKNIANIIDDDLNIQSAGLLQGGAVAWVQITTPETIVGPGGLEYWPYLMGFSSMNGTLSTGFTTASRITICDNTMSANIRDTSNRKIKFKHTSKSLARITDVRDALGIVMATKDNFEAEVEALLAEEVSEDRFNKFAYEFAGGDKVFEDAKPGRSLTMATTKREKLTALWTNDDRVTPWRGTALGVVQAVNTFQTWEGIVRGTDRFERNKLRAIKGEFDLLDQSTVNLLATV